MPLPKIKGIIERRILINYRTEKEVLENFLPAPFRPKLVGGMGMVGICLIRLKSIRPKGLPGFIGIGSENAAHRIAVEWEENGIVKEGVYVPRRDTSSRLNALAGGRIFPGKHYLADFEVAESNGEYKVAFTSEDGTYLSIQAIEKETWNENSVFEDMACASAFFENGSVGYSPAYEPDQFEGLQLHTLNWAVSSLEVEAVRSSFFENEAIFPPGTVQFDNALLMKNIDHEWIQLASKSKPIAQ